MTIIQKERTISIIEILSTQCFLLTANLLKQSMTLVILQFAFYSSPLSHAIV